MCPCRHVRVGCDVLLADSLRPCRRGGANNSLKIRRWRGSLSLSLSLSCLLGHAKSFRPLDCSFVVRTNTEWCRANGLVISSLLAFTLAIRDLLFIRPLLRLASLALDSSNIEHFLMNENWYKLFYNLSLSIYRKGDYKRFLAILANLRALKKNFWSTYRKFSRSETGKCGLPVSDQLFSLIWTEICPSRTKSWSQTCKICRFCTKSWSETRKLQFPITNLRIFLSAPQKFFWV